MKKFVPTIFVLSLITLSACVAAQPKTAPVVVDGSDLQNFADEFFPQQMEQYHIPGLVFIFVQDGETIYSGGYGQADLDTATPMNPASIIMRIGSVSKLFVASAVMQLVEQGKLDLHTDINQYLTTFQLSDTFPEPVILADLLTHTAGFEDPAYTSNTDPDQVQPLGAFLATHMPPRTHPPGETFIYSNYGYALAALVVEEVSGIPFDQYVEQNIFTPLEMPRSKYLVAPPVPENMATGYFYQNGAHIPQPMDYDSDYPGGSIVSTADEMSHFMLAHLQDGCYQGACILQADTLAGMHQMQAETPYEGQNVTFGFVEGYDQGQRMLGHSGAIRGFGNSLNLLPEHGAGYFFSFNAECNETAACEIISEFRKQLIARFYR
jgi:CubicO group peptidase (beta-lactamase class C family)